MTVISDHCQQALRGADYPRKGVCPHRIDANKLRENIGNDFPPQPLSHQTTTPPTR